MKIKADEKIAAGRKMKISHPFVVETKYTIDYNQEILSLTNTIRLMAFYLRG